MTMTRWIVLAGVCAGLLLAGLWKVRAHPPYEPVFHDRAVADIGKLQRLWRKSLAQEVIDHHQAVAERVLLIRDPAVVEHPDFDSDPQTLPANGAWSFASVIRLAFRLAGAPATSVQGYVDRWRETMNSQDYRAVPVAMEDFVKLWYPRNNSYTLEWAPVSLLAVVNRLDLARVDSNGCKKDNQTGTMRGTEIRFVYAALPYYDLDHYLSLIVEFVLPCMSKSDFKGLAKEWSDLEALNWSPANPNPFAYQQRLESLLSKWTNWTQSNMKPTTRLRINALNGGTWDVREFLFQANELTLMNLEREACIQVSDCQGPSSSLGTFLKDKNNVAAVLDSNYEFEKTTLATQVGTIDRNGRVLTLAPGVAGNDRDEVRRVLSINSCTGCHGPETSTEFHQIGQRQPKAPSPLSAFLTGAPDCQPHDGPIPLLSPVLPYCSVAPPFAGHCNPKVGLEQYNDLLRRHLFLDKVGSLDATADDPTWKNALDRFIAYQSH